MEQTDRTFAELVVERGVATREQVDECIEIVRKALELGAATSLPDTMVNKSYVSQEIMLQGTFGTAQFRNIRIRPID